LIYKGCCQHYSSIMVSQFQVLLMQKWALFRGLKDMCGDTGRRILCTKLLALLLVCVRPQLATADVCVCDHIEQAFPSTNIYKPVSLYIVAHGTQTIIFVCFCRMHTMCHGDTLAWWHIWHKKLGQ